MTISNLPFNLSPKLAYTILSLAITWVITHYAISLDPEISLGISTVIASIVGYKAPPGEVVGVVGPASDDLLPEGAMKHAAAGVPPKDAA